METIDTINTVDTEERNVSNNHVEVVGTIGSFFSKSHEIYMERFYTFLIDMERNSGIVDTIPCMVSERLLGRKFSKGTRVKIEGEFRSHNSPIGKLQLFIFVKTIETTEEEKDINKVFLKGYLCKPTVYRELPISGREITDLLIAVNRRYGKSDYIPAIVWGRNAKYAEGLAVGAQIELNGRIQSRNYEKKFRDNNGDVICILERTAYEISAYTIGEIKE